tara:strand:+ start:216 stop:1892 length:1677 start_codon:yes stop_codon:yes gene_type:complete
MELNPKSTWVKYHVPCTKCGSSDAVSINENNSAKCFACGEIYRDYYKETNQEQGNFVKPNKIKMNITESNIDGIFAPLTDRNISKETAQKYGVRVKYSINNEISQHIYPYYIGQEINAKKIRHTPKKGFFFEGDVSDTGLFGQNLFKEGGKYLTITEGELDAMSAFELMGSKWAAVSIKRGAQSAVKDIKESLEYVESFDNIVICFDNDKAGKEAALQVATILKPGKAKIMSLPNGYKDPNDMLMQGKVQDFVTSWWDSKLYTPAGILRLSKMKDEFLNREEKESVPYPWHGLNKKLYGLRQGELVTVCGGTGLGKSSITRELEHWLIKQTKDNIGVIALEEDWKRTADGILSIEANVRLYIDEVRKDFDQEKLALMYDELFNNDRVYVHAHFGTNSIEEILAKLRYLIIGCDCRWVVIDHLHMLVNAVKGQDDERRAIDHIVHSLRSIVEETGVGLILVSHLRRVDGNRGHEQGIEVSLSHLRGSQSIAQLSDGVISLERDQQAVDELEARTTKVRVLKSRYTGDVGLATHLIYDSVTGRLSEDNEFETIEEDEIPF